MIPSLSVTTNKRTLPDTQENCIAKYNSLLYYIFYYISHPSGRGPHDVAAGGPWTLPLNIPFGDLHGGRKRRRGKCVSKRGEENGRRERGLIANKRRRGKDEWILNKVWDEAGSWTRVNWKEKLLMDNKYETKTNKNKQKCENKFFFFNLRRCHSF